MMGSRQALAPKRNARGCKSDGGYFVVCAPCDAAWPTDGRRTTPPAGNPLEVPNAGAGAAAGGGAAGVGVPMPCVTPVTGAPGGGGAAGLGALAVALLEPFFLGKGRAMNGTSLNNLVSASESGGLGGS